MRGDHHVLLQDPGGPLVLWVQRGERTFLPGGRASLQPQPLTGRAHRQAVPSHLVLLGADFCRPTGLQGSHAGLDGAFKRKSKSLLPCRLCRAPTPPTPLPHPKAVQRRKRRPVNGPLSLWWLLLSLPGAAGQGTMCSWALNKCLMMIIRLRAICYHNIYFSHFSQKWCLSLALPDAGQRFYFRPRVAPPTGC